MTNRTPSRRRWAWVLSGPVCIAIIVFNPGQHCTYAMRAIYHQNISGLRRRPKDYAWYNVTFNKTSDKLHDMVCVPIVGSTLKIWLAEYVCELLA